MATGIPDTMEKRLQWYEQHITIWKATPAAVGLTAAQATLLDNAIKAARGSFDAAVNARNAAKLATTDQTAKMRTMNNTGGDTLSYIKAFAESQTTQAAQDAVFVAADLPLPTPPGPMPAPETPHNVEGDPNADGTVTVKWKANGNAGAVYLVYRRTGNNTQWSQVAITGEKKYIDPTVTAGTPAVQYQVRAVRGNAMSAMSNTAYVNFGQSMAA
jgi:hypothetical protein